MHADISRDSYRPDQNYSALVAQQGRALLDADANEQSDLLIGALRRFIANVVGPAAGPGPWNTFGFSVDNGDLFFLGGTYYVDGIEVLAGDLNGDLESFEYYSQPFAYLDKSTDPFPTTPYFAVYLRVFERLVTSVEDATIREVALGDLAPDTASRRQVVWQLLATEKFPGGGDLTPETYDDQWQSYMDSLRLRYNPMAARAVQPTTQDLCAVSPDASYRGCENQLYRVEVHNSLVTNSDGSVVPATYKWSRENGSVVFPIASYDGAVTVVLTNLGRDDRLSLEIGDWVELLDDAYVARLDDVAPPLRQVVQLDRATCTVTLNAGPASTVGTKPALHPRLRRWDQRPAVGDPAQATDGALTIVPADPTANIGWLDLEDGVQVLFPTRPTIGLAENSDARPSAIPPGQYNGGEYRRGEYWLVPARTLTGDVVWPIDASTSAPALLPPNGPDIHYAPIGLAQTSNGQLVVDSRKTFEPISTPFPNPEAQPASRPAAQPSA